MPKRTQSCNNCRYALKCYSERTTPRNVVINILACRIRKGINSNESTRLLLKMIRPKLLSLVNNARARVGGGYVNIEDLIRDLESRVIECLLDSENGYNIGGPAYLTEYLFGSNPRTGWVRKWILWNFSKQQRFYKKHTLVGHNPKSDTENEISEQDRIAISNVEEYNSNNLDESNKDALNAIMQIIDDGYTLNANEYRVLSFCLSHANESNKTRLIDGTHTYLANIMGVSRPRITRLFSVARSKITNAAKEHNIYL
jgi:hypothetical protein